jgi:hypothetical protein
LQLVAASMRVMHPRSVNVVFIGCDRVCVLGER